MPAAGSQLSLPFLFRRVRVLRGGALLLLGLAGAGAAHAALELYRERASPYDLALTGRLAGVPAGEKR